MAWRLASSSIHAKGFPPVQAEPLGGGQLLGAGRLWVSPAAELDPRAVRVHMEGRGLPAEAIITRYLPKVQAARRSVECICFASAAQQLQGSH